MRLQAYTAALITTSLAVFVFSSQALSVQPENAQSGEELFQRVKARAAEHLGKLPNYTCHATIDRMRRVRSDFRPLDTVELEVAFVGRQELFARSGESKFGEQPIEAIVSGGTIGNRIMGSHVDLILNHDLAEFKFAGEGKKDGHKTLRYDLHVPIEKSGFLVRHNGAVGVAGYEGSVWVDAETLDLVRVDLKVNKIPAHLGVRLIEQSMHYKNLTIGNSEFALPEKSDLAATDDMGNYSFNQVKLNNCHEFSADSVVKYAIPSQGTASRDAKDQ